MKMDFKVKLFVKEIFRKQGEAGKHLPLPTPAGGGLGPKNQELLYT